MPEGPEVRTLVDQLQPAVGQRLVDLQFLSGRYTRHGTPRGFDEFWSTMTTKKSHGSKNISSGHTVDHVVEWKAKGKFIYMILDNGGNVSKLENEEAEPDDYMRSIWITLGMSGRFMNDSVIGKVNNARWYLKFWNGTNDTNRKIYYLDTRNFGTLRFSLSKRELDDKLDSLGPDILNDCTESIFMDVLSSAKPGLNVCKFLMNQKKISGVGNYILSEALYRSNIDPFAALEELQTEQRKLLYREIITTARDSYASQGVTRKGGTFRNIEGDEGEYGFSLQCYGRDVCPRGEKIVRETDGPHGRTIWYVEDQLFIPRSVRLANTGDGRPNINSAYSKADQFNKKEKETTQGDEGRASDQNRNLEATLHDKSWNEALGSFLSSDKFKQLSKSISNERDHHTIYPPPDNVFSALNMCPVDTVKVVIVGQDPYHGPRQGHGLAFSVQKGVNIPPSLKNIFKEAVEDVGIDYPSHGNLEYWSKQGVLLLNTVLTVQRGNANSHKGMGWEDFTDEVIESLNLEKDGLIFLLWGNPAAKKGRGVNKEKHTVITTSHPSPLGATKTKTPFLGSKCFSRCNDALIAQGIEPIDWNIY